MSKLSLPAAIILAVALIVLAGGVYLERGDARVQAGVLALVLAALHVAQAALPGLVKSDGAKQ